MVPVSNLSRQSLRRAISPLRAHPYDPNAYLNIHDEGWEKLSGRREETTSQLPS
jgi:hypothetical protein